MRLFLGLVAGLLTLYNPLGYPSRLEKINCYGAVEASVHLAVEDLLNNIVHYIMKKVVPRKAEKEVLRR
jgi:hypothetical protein